MRSDLSTDFRVKLSARAIDCSEVGHKFMLLQGESHFSDDLVDLLVQFHSK